MTEVLDDVQAVAREVFEDGSLVLRPESKLGDFRRWDSHGHVSFVFAVEERFGVVFDEDEFVATRTVGGLLEVLSAKLPLP